MKRRVLKFDQFLVWIFTMNMGERKTFNPLEVNRGLTTHGPNTIYTIPVFTRGSFTIIRPGTTPLFCKEGEGGFEVAHAEHLEGQAIVAMENDCEYHCITPREDIPRYWNRLVFPLEAGKAVAGLPGAFYYLAKGKFIGIDAKLINIPKDKPMSMLRAEQDSILAALWLS